MTIAATLPYLTLKALWLTGHGTGAADAAGGAVLLDTVHLVGDVVTAGLEVAAIALALALTCGWGRRVPAVLVLFPMWVGTGLLAPIAAGVPLGLAVQAVAGGSPAPAGNGLHGWVYGCVYGGFLVQAVGLFALFPGYVRGRWPGLLRDRAASVVPGPRWAVRVAGAVAVGYAGALTLWAATGSRFAGPAGFETLAQRTYLAAGAVLVVVGVLAVAAARRPSRVRYVAGWAGTAVIALSGPTGVALSSDHSPQPGYVAVCLVAMLAGLVLTVLALRALRRPDRPAGTARALPRTVTLGSPAGR
ncbi:hypothetical protein Athai_32300 [Actinocatenispora thailandica]|uniref:LigA protein n=2 Tax=Actinocatenispora thailandica TaxID=227318 RepID=A0A7R7DQ63_9ACTN|nr:hypothetical protein Athai_32300 [Actinocatenispora thailandica]